MTGNVFGLVTLQTNGTMTTAVFQGIIFVNFDVRSESKRILGHIIELRLNIQNDLLYFQEVTFVSNKTSRHNEA